MYFPAGGGEPVVYGADLDEVLTTEVAADPPGTAIPDPLVVWSTASA
ncbi:MAG: hypothetical protein JWP48_5127 [Actinoallomurus sp.]|jgi:hypothetical protein|nr:hypothetical protein [Actinoallomurus sp.]